MLTFDPRRTRHSAELIQARAPESFQIVSAVFLLLDEHLAPHPREREAGLDASQRVKRSPGKVYVSCHGGGGRERAVARGHVGALTDAFAREPYRLLVIAPNEFGVGGNRVIDRGEWVTQAEAQRVAGRLGSLLPTPETGKY
jgi:hypothetical protein